MIGSPTLCLCMIVRNEERVIARALRSVKGIIDYWIVCDTGSTDATPIEVINALSGVPGQLHRTDWVNFGFNRTEAIQLARQHADYLLIMDADMVANVYDRGFKKNLWADIYDVRYEGDIDYSQPMLVSARHDWHYQGTTHEYIEAATARTQAELPQLTLTHLGDGAMRADKYVRDAKLLSEAIKENPNDSRTVFYLAQSYYYLGRFEQALPFYIQRSLLAGWDEERWYAMYMEARARHQTNQPWGDVLEAYKRAYAARPSRLEPLYEIVKHYREMEDYETGYAYASIAVLHAPYPKDQLFIEKSLHLYLFPLELAVCAYGSARLTEAIEAFNLVLRRAPSEKWIVESAVRGRSMALTDLSAIAPSETDQNHPNHLVVVVPFHNAGSALSHCVKSLLEQDYDDFKIILIDDASIDKSLQVIPRDPRIRTIVRKQRRGLASNLHDVLLNVCSQDDIVVCVDGDDWLLKSDVLSCIDETYRQAGCWVTFGQFEFSNGDYGFSQPFSSEADFSTLREYFRTSHLRTFRAGLFQRIAEQDPHYSCLKDENGAWLSSAVDAALMCPLLELAGFHRARFVDRVLYHYNNEGPNHVHSLDRQGQIKNFECIRRKPRFSQVEHYLAVMEVQ